MTRVLSCVIGSFGLSLTRSHWWKICSTPFLICEYAVSRSALFWFVRGMRIQCGAVVSCWSLVVALIVFVSRVSRAVEAACSEVCGSMVSCAL